MPEYRFAYFDSFAILFFSHCCDQNNLYKYLSKSMYDKELRRTLGVHPVYC